MADIRLDDLSFGDPDIDAAFREWREAIERANTWAVGGHAEFSGSPSGYTLFVKGYPGPVSALAASGGITAAPDANTLGQGNAVLRYRNGATLVNGPTVRVYSNFSTAIPAGTRIEVAPDGADYKLVGSDCPTP